MIEQPRLVGVVGRRLALGSLLLLSLVVGPWFAAATIGVDISVETTPEIIECFADAGIAFVIPRVYRSVGAVDPNGGVTMKLARAQQSFKFVDGYIFPCIQSSAYSVAHNVSCASAKQQVQDTLTMLKGAGVALPLRLWLDVEDEQPSKYYSDDTAVNQQFLGEMTAELLSSGVQVGVYTTKTYWQQIMANQEGYGKYPLWYPRYDGIDSFDFFSPFADWTEAFIKQTAGDTPGCGSKFDSDYML